MIRQRILLHENDDAILGLLCDLFADESLDVTVCDSLDEIKTMILHYPLAVVVSDSWINSDNHVLNPRHRADIIELSKTAEVVLITARQWALNIHEGELGSAIIVIKPFDLSLLMTVIRGALARSVK